MSADNPPIEFDFPDLRRWEAGAAPYIHVKESGKPGPTVMVTALTHGNEFCGMTAATHMLDSGVRPRIGTLTVSFSNVAAYETFDPARPFESRQLVHNFNRIWSAQWLDGPEDSPELRRARAMRPVLDAADHILDLHSTSQDVTPFWVYPAFERNAAVAVSIGRPSVHMVMPGGLGSGTPIIQYGRHGEASGQGVALVAECGQHFLRSTSDLAVEVALDFVAHFGLIERAVPSQGPQRRFELLQTLLVKTPEFAFTRPVIGFESYAKGELIATDGGEEIRSPCENCTILMPTRKPVLGREAVYLTRPMD